MVRMSADVADKLPKKFQLKTRSIFDFQNIPPIINFYIQQISDPVFSENVFLWFSHFEFPLV